MCSIEKMQQESLCVAIVWLSSRYLVERSSDDSAVHVNFESTKAGRAAIKALDTLDVYVFTMTGNQDLKDALIEKAEKGYQFRTKLGK